MSKLVDLLKYESGANVVPGFLRTLREPLTLGRYPATDSDSRDFIRTLPWAALTEGELRELLISVPKLVSDEHHVVAAMYTICTLVAFEAMKYFVDKATYKGMNWMWI